MMKKTYYKLLIAISLFFTGTLYLNAEDNASIRIMPLGDSITYDNRESDLSDPRPISTRSGYRSHLWYMLQDIGFGADFVGSRVAGASVTPPFDPDNEGHPGWHSLDIAERAYSYMANSQPDIVLLHIGTNDHGTFAGGVDNILNEINQYENESGKPIHVFVALIIDRREHDKIISQFNENVKKVVASRILAGDQITLVDMYQGAGLSSADYADNTHPNSNGYYKMAVAWFNALTKPYNQNLTAFPYTIVDAKYIESTNINETATAIDIVIEVPDTGILF